MCEKGLEMLLDGFADITLGVFDGFSVTETAWQGRAIRHITVILGLFLDNDFKRVVFHLAKLSLAGV
jgi:hypothetical protein